MAEPTMHLARALRRAASSTASVAPLRFAPNIAGGARARWPEAVYVREGQKSPDTKFSVEEALYLAKEAGFFTTWEVEMQIVKSPPFSPRESPFLLENFFKVSQQEQVDFDVKLDVKAGRAIGLSFDATVISRRQALVVQAITPGSLIDTWNSSNPEKAVAPGDMLLEANEVEGDPEELVRVLTTAVGTGQPVTIRMRRGKARQNRTPMAEDADFGTEAATATEEKDVVHPVIHGTIKKLFRADDPATFSHSGEEWLARAEGRGTRKRATAHAVITRGTGLFKVNGDTDVYSQWPMPYHRFDVCQPFKLTGTCGVYDVFVEVQGGGPGGKAGATRLAVARALLEANPGCHDDLQKGFCLLEDARQKMSKMPGRAGARKNFPWTKR